MRTFWKKRIAMCGLLAFSVLTGATATVIAAENDNDLSTYDATSFYQKLDQERGGQ